MHTENTAVAHLVAFKNEVRVQSFTAIKIDQKPTEHTLRGERLVTSIVLEDIVAKIYKRNFALWKFWNGHSDQGRVLVLKVVGRQAVNVIHNVCLNT